MKESALGRGRWTVMNLQQRPLVGALELRRPLRELLNWGQGAVPLHPAHQRNAGCRLPPEGGPNLGRSSSFTPRAPVSEGCSCGYWREGDSVLQKNPSSVAWHVPHSHTGTHSAACSVTRIKLLNTQRNQILQERLKKAKWLAPGRETFQNKVLWFFFPALLTYN